MKILIYCQHVLGIGHLFRTLEIARAMTAHQVILLLGGPPVAVPLPDHVRVVQLPSLEMDEEFSSLRPVDHTTPLADVQEQRKTMLLEVVADFRPDVLIVELFPFGRNGFSFELLPLLEAIRSGSLPACRVVCSVRDILVEKKDQQKFEARVVDRLNRFFDAVLVHGDPAVITLDATFTRVKDIAPPVVYTGYVCQRAESEEGKKLRRSLELQDGQKLIVASAGSGSVGQRLLSAAIRATAHLPFPCRLQVFTGPYLDSAGFEKLRREAPSGIKVERFTDRFPTWLAAADLSISMGGYNTTMNVIASGVPALVFPFGQNREQRLRGERIVPLAVLDLLDGKDLEPTALAGKISNLIGRTRKQVAIRLDGASFTSNWLDQWAGGN